MDRGRPVHHQRTRRPTAFRLALLLSTAVAMGSVAGTASASVDPATYTINPASGSNVGSEPVTISGPNVAEVVGVFFGRSFVDVQPLSQNQIQLYTPGGLPGNVEVKLDFVGEDDVVVPGGFTYVESDAEPDPDPSEPATTIVEPPLAETGASSAPLGMLAAALVVGGASALLVVTSVAATAELFAPLAGLRHRFCRRPRLGDANPGGLPSGTLAGRRYGASGRPTTSFSDFHRCVVRGFRKTGWRR